VRAGHKDAHNKVCSSAFNIKDASRTRQKKEQSVRLFLPARIESDSLSRRGFYMNARLFAVLIVVGLALVGGGCASMFHRHKTSNHKAQKHSREVLLPRQTGSNLDRRITIDDESSLQATKKKRPESRHPSKKTVQTAPTEPERVEPEKPKKPEKPEETTPPPDRFR
jgi:hypothetical protein